MSAAHPPTADPGSAHRVIALWLPELTPNSAHDLRRWHQALERYEEIVLGCVSARTGLGFLRARGPSRYYGSETRAAETLYHAAIDMGFTSVGIGVAHGYFAAEHAAYASESVGGIRIISDELTAQFLAPLPIELGVDTELAEVLLGLGIRTLGAFAALPEHTVRERFGQLGVAALKRASGEAAPSAMIPTASPRHEFTAACEFDTPLDDADALAFSCSSAVSTFADTLIAHGLVCTELRVTLVDDTGGTHERQWAHPSRFTPADMLNRIRWQATSLPHLSSQPSAHEHSGAGVVSVRLAPIRTARAADHEPGLWNTAPDERIHHHLSRVQSLLGYEQVTTGQVTGGRLSADRQRFLTWGSRGGEADRPPRPAGPWPGRITGATPSRVFPSSPPVQLLDHEGNRITIDPDELLSEPPAQLLSREIAVASSPVHAWSAPWPLREGWWRTGSPHARTPPTAWFRLQVLLRNGDAWLLRCEHTAAEPSNTHWFAEGRYD